MDSSTICNAVPPTRSSAMLSAGPETSVEQMKPVSRLLVRRRKINGERSMLVSTVMIRNPRALVAHDAGFEVFRDRHGGVDIHSGAGHEVRLYDPQLLRYVALDTDESEEALRERVGRLLGPTLVLRDGHMYIVAHLLADPLVPNLVGQVRHVRSRELDFGVSPGAQTAVKGWFEPLCEPVKTIATPRGYAGAREIKVPGRSW
jgi:hypothetical protein